jgi:hypothetical protein
MHSVYNKGFPFWTELLQQNTLNMEKLQIMPSAGYPAMH